MNVQIAPITKMEITSTIRRLEINGEIFVLDLILILSVLES